MRYYHKTEIEMIFSVTNLATIAYKEYSKNQSFSESHDFWELMYLDKGKIDIFLNDEPFHVEAGQLIIYEPGVSHAFQGDSDGSYLCFIGFDCQSSLLETLKNCVLSLNPEEKKTIAKIIADGIHFFNETPTGFFIKDDIPSYGMQKIKNQIELLLISLFNSYTLYDSFKKTLSLSQEKSSQLLTEEVIDYLKENIAKNLTIETICKDLQISASNIKKAFNAQFSCGVISYFINLKIKTAQKLIREEDMNFSQISEYLGFFSCHYFSRTFKQKTGMTPTQYRESIKQYITE